MSLISFLFLTLVSSVFFVTGDGQPLPTEPPEGGGGEGLETLPPLPEDDDVFIAFARVFSGCLRKGSSVYVLGPKHDPSVALQKVGYLILNKLDLNPDYMVQIFASGLSALECTVKKHKWKSTNISF